MVRDAVIYLGTHLIIRPSDLNRGLAYSTKQCFDRSS